MYACMHACATESRAHHCAGKKNRKKKYIKIKSSVIGMLTYVNCTRFLSYVMYTKMLTMHRHDIMVILYIYLYYLYLIFLLCFR